MRINFTERELNALAIGLCLAPQSHGVGALRYNRNYFSGGTRVQTSAGTRHLEREKHTGQTLGCILWLFTTIDKIFRCHRLIRNL